MYKDKDKQREADKARQRRYRARPTRGHREGVTDSGRDKQGVTGNCCIDHEHNFTGEIAIPKRTAKGNIRVSKPGNADYEPQCETSKAFVESQTLAHLEGEDCKSVETMIEDVRKNGGEYSFKTVKGKVQDVHHTKPKTTRFPAHKRGQDIKCFEDLPLDVQQTIRRTSDSNEEFQKRTAAAIHYQHLFPDRY